jgi:hypothetical protein
LRSAQNDMPSTRRRVIGWDQVASVCLRLLPALLAALRVPATEETLAGLSTLLQLPRLATVSANPLQLIAHDRCRFSLMGRNWHQKRCFG